MELKCTKFQTLVHLIIGSNRTFMELKFQVKIEITKIMLSSNRTFMELKFVNSRTESKDSKVLIAPLWN